MWGRTRLLKWIEPQIEERDRHEREVFASCYGAPVGTTRDVEPEDIVGFIETCIAEELPLIGNICNG